MLQSYGPVFTLCSTAQTKFCLPKTELAQMTQAFRFTIMYGILMVSIEIFNGKEKKKLLIKFKMNHVNDDGTGQWHFVACYLRSTIHVYVEGDASLALGVSLERERTSALDYPFITNFSKHLSGLWHAEETCRPHKSLFYRNVSRIKLWTRFDCCSVVSLTLYIIT